MSADELDHPSKRPRLEAPADPGTPFDDMDDLYGTPADGNTPQKTQAAVEGTETTLQPSGLKEVETVTAENDVPGIPGLGMLPSDSSLEEKSTMIETQDGGAQTEANLDKAGADQTMENVLETQIQGPNAEQNRQSATGDLPPAGDSAVHAEMIEAHQTPDTVEQSEKGDKALPSLEVQGTIPRGEENPPLAVEPTISAGKVEVPVQPGTTILNGPDATHSATITENLEAGDLPQATLPPTATDTEAMDITKAHQKLAFLEAAERNKEDKQAEWQVDSSEESSSSSDDTTSSDSDSSDEEDDYELLNPEEQARILMQGEGASEDEGGERKGKAGAGASLRTKNEVAEDHVEKPNVELTPDMKVEELGAVQSIVENMLVIKAKVSGEYRVLESGSLLCLADRNVIGVVGETLGRVQQPFYSVRFNSPEEISESSISIGTTIYYVEQHSTYVLTRPLQAIKGSDASNLHDEEVGEEELEFSDDEAEAEHKKRVKQERQSKRGARRGAPNVSSRSLPQRIETANLNYDDTRTAATGEELYTPLARPTNLHELMTRGPPPDFKSQQRGANKPAEPRRDKGRHRDRGRGRGGGGGGGRGRGGPGYDHGGNRNVPSFNQGGRPEDFHPHGHTQYPPHMQQPPAPAYSPQAPHLQQYPSPLPQQQHFMQQPYPPPQSPYGWNQPPPVPSPTYPPYPYNQQQGYPPAPPLASPGGTFPPGAYINPAFFRHPQQQPSPVQPQHQWSPPPQSPQQGSMTGGGRMSPEADAAFRAAQEKLDILRRYNHPGSGGGPP
ncbi:MAG: mannosyltransferase [Chaenotheca gracillima]|nr:MAG: mannosyltransferase [Chaenotheca gracillima]